jgi:hypothetical protein
MFEMVIGFLILGAFRKELMFNKAKALMPLVENLSSV